MRPHHKIGWTAVALLATPCLSLTGLSAAQAQIGVVGPKGVDHYLCYEITDTSDFKGQRVKVRDQFGAGTGTAFKPTQLCNPVDKNGEGILNREGHLVCYAFDPGEFPDAKPHTVLTRNQFGEAKLRTARFPEELCVPSFKKVIE